MVKSMSASALPGVGGTTNDYRKLPFIGSEMRLALTVFACLLPLTMTVLCSGRSVDLHLNRINLEEPQVIQNENVIGPMDLDLVANCDRASILKLRMTEQVTRRARCQQMRALNGSPKAAL